MKTPVKIEVTVTGGGGMPIKVPNKANKQITSRVEKSAEININEDYTKKIDDLFSNSISSESLLNEYRRNMILLDIQTEVLCEIPIKQNSTDILEVESVKNAFATMSETIMLALQADSSEKVKDILISIDSMANSIITLFSPNKISDRYTNNMKSYMYALYNRIVEEIDSK